MTLVKTGGGVTDIRGGFGGVYFTRDKSGLHCSAKPRRVHQRTAGQKIQRDAFNKARAACLTVDPAGKPRDWLNRWVSYYIYRALNGLPFIFDTIVTGNPDPDCTGKYTLAGTYNEKDYYERDDSAYFIWWLPVTLNWFISIDPGEAFPAWENETHEIEGLYTPTLGYSGNPIVKIELRPPPIDYQIPKL